MATVIKIKCVMVKITTSKKIALNYDTGRVFMFVRV